MAKSFLSENDRLLAEKILTDHKGGEGAALVSNFLHERLLGRLSAHRLWEKTQPIALGSWSRMDLCPKSDIDLLFVGPETAVKELTTRFEQEGLKLRYRVPQNPQDWTEGVQAFDVIALLSAFPFFKETQTKLDQQLALIRAKKIEKVLLRAMLHEREERAKRYDSINQFLEPNLKYGPGGLRDLEQAMVVHKFFMEGRENYLAVSTQRAEQALRERKEFLLELRQKLQLKGGSEILAANLQREIAQWSGFEDLRQFMGEVQKALADVSFYADWMIEKRLASTKRLKQIEDLQLRRLDSAFSVLEKDPSVLVQERVRNELQSRKAELDAGSKAAQKQWGKVLTGHVHPKMSDETVRAYFRSWLLAKVVHDLERVTGLVQHDQYHRLTVETHTLQAVREVLRVKKAPRLLGRLAKHVRSLDEKDWSILLWTALYHDLGKGLEGDHSTLGSEIVKRDLTLFGVSLRQTIEVAWMVQSHLLLSGAAFRQNPQAPATWKWLFDHGLKGKRITSLAVFTAIDIRATNIEAWNDWKERLLTELADTLLSPKAQKFEGLLEKIAAKKIKLEREFLEPLDPALVEELPNKILVEDYARLIKRKDLEPLVVRARKKNEVWVRFHSAEDRTGLFFNYVARLYRAGTGIQEAFVQTYPHFGVYDWFKVKSSRSPQQLLRLLEAAETNVVNPAESPHAPEVKFESIDLVRTEGKTAILSFRGRDQKGALVAASQALHQAGLSLRWARVHTWGQQIDDVFFVEGEGVVWPKIVDGLRQKFLPE